MATHPALRVLKRIDINEPGCWIWPGWTNNVGYGGVISYPPFSPKQCSLFVHRVMYEWFIGEIPPHLEIDHLCRVRACCNPAHLELVTRSENIRRAFAVKTSCPQGHPYPENVMVKKKGSYCGACSREYGRRYRAARRAHGDRARQSA